MFYVAYCIPEQPLITMGDAVASFLQRPDYYSQGLCLLSIHDVREGGYKTSTRQWTNERFRWKDIASKKRRATTLSLYATTPNLHVNAQQLINPEIPDHTDRRSVSAWLGHLITPRWYTSRPRRSR